MLGISANALAFLKIRHPHCETSGMQIVGISEKAFAFLQVGDPGDPVLGEKQESGEFFESEHSSVPPICLWY